jgi:WD40 repeat protein
MFSPDGNWVLTSTADGPSSDDELGRIRIWKVGVWELAQSFAKPRGYLAFSADSTHVLFGGFDAPVSAGNIHDGSVRDVLRSDGDDGAFCEVYFSRDGRYAVELNREGRMKLWDIQRSAVIRARSWTRQSIVHVWSENGLVGVTTDEPAGVVLLSFDTLSPLCELPCTPVSYQALDLSRRCGTLATCDTLSPLRFWDSNNGTPINVAREPHRYGRTEAFQFSPVAQRLATSWYDLDAGRHVVVELAYTLDPTQRMA